MNARGFTLVEISIVLIVIGLLIGGILKGQELILGARVKSDITAVKSVEVAMLTFYGSYNAYPGDVMNPGDRIPHCPTGSSCGRVYPNQGNGTIDFPCNDTDFFESEERQFFSHLAATNMLTGIQSEPSAPLTPGESIPLTSLGKGMMILYTGTPNNPGNCVNARSEYYFNEPSGIRPFASTALGNIGHYMLIGVQTGFSFGMDPFGVTPRFASRLDKTIDDGLPYSGSVQVGNLNGKCAETYPVNDYKEDDGGVCELLVKLNSINSAH